MSLLKKTIVTLIFSIIFIFGTGLVVVWYQLAHRPLLHRQQSLVIQIPRGTGIAFFSAQLQKAGLLKYPRFFIFITELNGQARHLKAGEYEITDTMTVFDLLNHVVTGKVMQRSMLFVEGWTFSQYKKALLENPHIEHTIDHLSDAQIMEKLGYPKQHPEGLFFPDTYFFVWGDTDLSLLKAAYQRMQSILAQQWQQRDEQLPYKNSYEALIVASLIEKETALAEERPLISGVILRRLQKNMLLQIDPTVLYGLGRPYGDRITKDDLAVDTPYNTYQRYNLPPTPIDMPGKASLFAALHPDQGEALYYVSKGDGSHYFSKTYDEHKEAIKKYLRSEG